VLQVSEHAPAVQLAVACAPPEQLWPHVPQFVTEVFVFVSQPFAYIESQSANPPPQLRTVHLAAVHVADPFATVHTFPHDPQFATLVWVSAHVEPHRISLAVQPLEHAYVPLDCIEHVGVGSVHVVPHAPQFAPSPRNASQPVDGS
jgi:hypothetical protein